MPPWRNRNLGANDCANMAGLAWGLNQYYTIVCERNKMASSANLVGMVAFFDRACPQCYMWWCAFKFLSISLGFKKKRDSNPCACGFSHVF